MHVSKAKPRNIECHVRMKPVPHVELADALRIRENVITISPKQRGVNSSITSEMDFQMTKIIPMDADQGSVFKSVVADVIDEALNGTSGCVLAYGQTGAGKTYTMTGPGTNYNDRGMIPRSISHVFHHVEKMNHNAGKSIFTIRISYVEIYQDRVIDLLTKEPPVGGMTSSFDFEKLDMPQLTVRAEKPDSNSNRSISIKNSLQVTEDRDGTVLVSGLSMPVVRDESEALSWLFTGESNRVIAEHSLNNASTRSHCVFTFYIEQEMLEDSFLTAEGVSHGPTNPSPSNAVEENLPNSLRSLLVRSKFHLVDLAGSERIEKTNSKGTVRKEAQSINQSLSFLEQVVLALTEKDRKHIPYRSSKLTHLLKDALGGNSITRVIVAIWPHMHHVEETVSTLRFALRMMRVETKPRRKVVDQANGDGNSVARLENRRLVAHYEEIIEGLKSELAMRDMLQSSMYPQTDFIRSPKKKVPLHDELTSQDRQWVTQVVDHFIQTGVDRGESSPPNLDTDLNPSTESGRDIANKSSGEGTNGRGLPSTPQRPRSLPARTSAPNRPVGDTASPKELSSLPLLGGRLYTARQVVAAFHVFRDKLLTLQTENENLRRNLECNKPSTTECLDNPDLCLASPKDSMVAKDSGKYFSGSVAPEDAVQKKEAIVQAGMGSSRVRASSDIPRSQSGAQNTTRVNTDAEGDPTPAVVDDSVRQRDISEDVNGSSKKNTTLYENAHARDTEVSIWIVREGKDLYSRYSASMESCRQITQEQRSIMTTLNELKRSIDDYMTKLRRSEEKSANDAKLMNLSEEQARKHHETYVKNIQTMLNKAKLEYREKWDVLIEKKKEASYLEQSTQQLKLSVATAFSEYWARKCGMPLPTGAYAAEIAESTDFTSTEPSTYPDATELGEETVSSDDIPEMLGGPAEGKDRVVRNVQRPIDENTSPSQAPVARGSGASAVMMLSKSKRDNPAFDIAPVSPPGD